MKIDPNTWKPQAYATQFLLEAYKLGYYVFQPNQFGRYSPDAIKQLVQFKFVEKVPGFQHTEDVRFDASQDYKYLLTPTQKGIDYIKERLTWMLQNYHMYLLYPVLVKGDLIDVTKDFRGTGDMYVKNADGIAAGTYKLQQIDRYTLAVLDDRNTLFRIKSFPIKECLKLTTPIGTVEEELCKRFPKIRVKSLTKRLNEAFARKFGEEKQFNLSVLKLVGKLYETQMSERVEE